MSARFRQSQSPPNGPLQSQEQKQLFESGLDQSDSGCVASFMQAPEEFQLVVGSDSPKHKAEHCTMSSSRVELVVEHMKTSLVV